VEFWSLARIQALTGAEGVRRYLPYEDEDGTRYGLITDDTQMTLFTVEGLIRAGVRRDRGIGFTVAVVHAAYDRWLDTQTRSGPDPEHPDGWLSQQPWLYARRAPGATCLDALTAARAGGRRMPQYGRPAVNDSKGCGGVMRAAPFGLLPPELVSPRDVFEYAAEAAGYTHGHRTGQLASGALAATVAGLVAGNDLDAALDTASTILAAHDGHDETSRALERARAAATVSVDAETVESLGGGWVAEEALAVAVYAALVHSAPDRMLDALALAVTHSGDSDSTGAICGNVLGALHGDTALPPALTFEVEGRATILEIADDFVWEFTCPERLHGEYGPDTRWTERY
jgi:ADP-ribosylglycohydrolase